jgi:hypothetical protein
VTVKLGLLRTATETAVEVAVAPALSVTFAVNECVPSELVELSHLTVYGDIVAVPMTVPSTMKSTRVIVTPVPATGVAVRDTVRFTVAPGEVRLTEEGVVMVVPPVIPPPVVVYPPVIVYMLPLLPPQAASTVVSIPTRTSGVRFRTVDRGV